MLPRLNNSCSPDAQHGDIEGQLSLSKSSRENVPDVQPKQLTDASPLAYLH